MEPAKSFNNIIIGQFVLTGVPVKVYVDGRHLTITDTDDVISDPTVPCWYNLCFLVLRCLEKSNFLLVQKLHSSQLNSLTDFSESIIDRNF